MSIKKIAALKPVVLTEIIVVVILVSGGMALAFTHSQTVTDDDSILGGIQYELPIGSSDNTVTDYDLTYSGSNVTAVTGNLAGANGDKCYVTVLIGDDDFSPSETKKSDLVTFSGVTASFTCTLGTPIAESDVTEVRFIVEKTLDA